MKRYIIVLIVMTFWCDLTAQDTKTGSDESSIILNNSNLGFDFGKTALSFKLNNLSLRKNKAHGILWGVSGEGKNSEGITSIFSSSEIVPSSKLGLFLGYSISNTDDLSKSYLSLSKSEKDRVLEFQKKFKLSIDKSIKDSINALQTPDNATYKILITEYDKVKNAKSNIYTGLKKAFDKLSKDNSKTQKARDIAAFFVKTYFTDNPDWKLYNKSMDIIIKSRNQYTETLSSGYRRTSLYMHYGNAATKFNTFKGWDSLKLSDSFEKNTFRGNNGGFGINHNLGSKWIFGFRYTYEETNNLSTLSTTEYKLTTTNTAVNTTGSTEIKKTAYPDAFKTVYLNNYDFDVIRFIPYGDNHILLLDIYLRVNESLNENRLVSTTDLGISGSFFNGKKGSFIGGVYLQVPDINQNVERKKVEVDQDLKPIYERLSFGIFTKFSFTKLRETVY